MAGKSTLLRMVGLICLLSQVGSFVPATHVEIGVVDKLFSRVGSTDDISQDRSSFLCEMLETADFLNNATPRSLVLMDEIGRGTSAIDGLAIAASTLGHLHSIGCRSLFATHYHELADVPGDRIVRKTLAVAEGADQDIIFLHKVVDGVANASYGLHVAKLAGVPSSVLNSARILFGKLEKIRSDAVKQVMKSSPIV
jgi:DNA mismatch repair protein MutS